MLVYAFILGLGGIYGGTLKGCGDRRLGGLGHQPVDPRLRRLREEAGVHQGHQGLPISSPFLPAAKPSGPRMVRVVGVVGGRDWDPTPKRNQKKGIPDIEVCFKS